MEAATLAVIVPALVEIAKEILALFKSKRSNSGRRSAAKKFILKRYPDLKEHLQNLLIELLVYAHKQGMDEQAAAAYIERFIAWNDQSAKPEPTE